MKPSLSISSELHHELTPSLKKFGLLSRMADYYKDCVFHPPELGELERHCRSLLSNSSDGTQTAFFEDFLKLVKDVDERLTSSKGSDHLRTTSTT